MPSDNSTEILILGSSGVIGTAIERVCALRGIDCLGLSHDDFELTDRESLEGVIDRYRPRAVINCVVYMGIDPCEENPDRAFAVNATAVLYLAQICEARGITLAQPSSHAVFDGKKDNYYTEDDEVALTGIYAASKYVSERFAADNCRKHYITRFPMIFGERRNNSPGFADKVIGWLKEGRELRIADDKIDTPTYSLDAAEAVIDLLQEDKPYGIYHIGNRGKTSYYDFAVKLAKVLGIEAVIHRAKEADFPAKGFKPLKTAMKSVKLPPLRSWEEALEDYIKEIKG